MSPSTQSTQFSLYYMLFGKEMSLPIDTALIPEEIIDQVPDKFIDEIIKRVKTKHDVARSNVQLTQNKNKEYYDKKTKLPNFKVGDKVFLKIGKVEIGKKKKLEPKWMGPYSIIESRYNLIYKLLDLKTPRPVKSFIHANRLKPYKYLVTLGPHLIIQQMKVMRIQMTVIMMILMIMQLNHK